MERWRAALLCLLCAAVLGTCEGVDTSCVAAGFTECCVRDGPVTCQLGSGCFCDRSCYSTDQCCEDISATCQPDPCDPNPCDNGGVCVLISDTEYACQCMYGYAGDNCEIDIDFCLSAPCLNGGSCTDGVFTFSCDCPSGFSGRQCQDDTNECASNPCVFGTCMDGAGEFTCACDSGYTGVRCDANIDDCSPDPCFNNGTCIDGVNTYTCECAPSFAGVDCSLMSECTAAEDTCENNGVCIVEVIGGTRRTFCECLAGFMGDSCELDINECAGNPCQNGGSCRDLTGEYMCECPAGFTGQNCTIEIDECDTVFCQNGAFCLEGECFCPNGYTGMLCEVNINDCMRVVCQNNGNCTDGIASFMCECEEGFTGDLCEVPTSHPCGAFPCQNGATCEMVGSTDYACTCASGFTGTNCSTQITPCLSSPCSNSIMCIDREDSFECVCMPGYTGLTCGQEIDECTSEPCMNGASCQDMLNGYLCLCLDGFEGDNCERNIDDCSSDPCQNNGTCEDGIAAYACLCPVGYTGGDCETNINDCDPLPCQNNATCVDLIADFLCMCPLGFTGRNCAVNIPDCLGGPCENGGTCIDRVGGYQCECTPGFTGDNCMNNIDDCTPESCFGAATCVDGIESVTCMCPSGFTGPTCDTEIDPCTSNPCGSNGNCTSQLGAVTCVCMEGFTGTFCETRLCTLDCQNGASCVDQGDSFACLCPPGLTGELCDTQVDICEMVSCMNNATCVSLNDSFLCICSAGFTGMLCELDIDDCAPDPCENDGICVDQVNGFECMCRNGFTGSTCQINIDDCASNPCRYNSTCTDLVANYSCECAPGYGGRDCMIDIDLCTPQPCVNGASCTQNLTEGSVLCSCPPQFTGQFCEVDVDECNATAQPCLNGGTCHNTFGGFTCSCRDGFTGPRCESIDRCSPSICQNNATCVDTGLDFLCVCLAGYTGVICDSETMECASNPCQNNGICNEGFLNFTCTCTADYTGRVCGTDLNPCSSGPCANEAQCLNGPAGSEDYECVCAPGYTGEVCDIDIDDCESNPCLMGSTCRDAINNFTCDCASGFGGRFCDVNLIDDCNISICLNGGTCEDIGDDFRCVCLPGFHGQICEFGTNECLDNPCLNGGTCRDLINTYECVCVAGFTGMACEENIDDCVSVDCNNGSCRDLVNGFSCECDPGYTGERCGGEVDECEGVVCENGGSCRDGLNSYTCECARGYEGQHCEENIDDCVMIDCHNGSCVDLVDDYLCQCEAGYTGPACDQMIDDCEAQPCLNGATCYDQLNNFTCECVLGFTGRLCEEDINDCLNVICENGGNCTDLLADFQCVCVQGYTGEFCQENIDDCVNVDCNNGSCRDLVNGFSCECDPGYTGERCGGEVDECEGVVCENGGSCRDGLNSYTCECARGYGGQHCEENIDDCVMIDCHNGSCVDLVDDYLCQCEAGYTGLACDQMIDDCEAQPCMNGATCYDQLNNFTCECVLGFTGRLCEEDINDCLNVICENEGNCTDLLADFQCVCVQGYTGEFCQENIDDCVNVDCNNGSCRDLVNGFSCECDPGYTGERCGGEVDECEGVVCENGGSCRDGLNSYTCECARGYEGQHCEENIDDCVMIDCHNGSCVDLVDDYLCQCEAGYTGLACDQMIDDCEAQPCMNGATCYDTLNNFTCACLDGFEGRYCGTNIDDCLNNTCLNGASCVDGINEFTCACLHGYTGPACGEIIDFCESQPCQNSATCMSTVGSFVCLCSPLFTGELCGTQIDRCQEAEPCSNGGQCLPTVQDGLPSFQCECVGPYSGTTCEVFDPCVQSPCVSGGTCLTAPNSTRGYECSCPSPFLGYNCLYSDLCLLNQPCDNGATCINNIPSVDDVVGQGSGDLPEQNTTCLCLPDFTGAACEEEITACYYLPCQNGGSCLVDPASDLGYSCRCTLMWGGTNCTQEITVPAFGGQSYLTLPLPSSSSPSNLSSSLYLRTRTSTGLLYYTASDGTFVSISIENRAAVLSYDLGSGVEDIRGSFFPVDDSSWHHLSLLLSPTELCLAVDGSQFCRESGVTEGSRLGGSEVHIGGVPDYSALPSALSHLSGFVGCVDGLVLNSQPTGLLEGATSGENITRCVMGACGIGSCQNGGLCRNDSTAATGFTCSCSLGFTGDTCGDEVNIITPLFQGRSYLTHTLPAAAEFNYSFALLTTQLSGLILYGAESDSHTTQEYIALGLEWGQLVLHIRSDSETTELRTTLNVSDNTWHVVTAHAGSGLVLLQTDEEEQQASVASSSPLAILPQVFVGGLTDFSLLPDEVNQMAGFVGCVHDRMANGQSVELGAVAHTGREVEQCQEPVCPYIQCQNGATCLELGQPPGYLCECPPQFSGMYCETAVQFCDPNPCLFGGRCREEETTFSCRCPLERGGRTCEDELTITTPSFSGESYITYPPLSPSLTTLTVTITFIPTTSSGLLFLTSMAETEFRDFFSLALVNGQFEFRYNLGSGVAVIRSADQLELNTWHVVTAMLNSASGQLIVDNQSPITGSSPSPFTILNTRNNVWLGGYESFINLTSITNTSSGFSGCISSLTIDGSSVVLIIDADFGYDVAQCDADSCASNPCLNGGTCIEEGPSFICECLSEFTGSLCGYVVDPCQAEPGLCGEGATCQPSQDGLGYRCLCPLGRAGDRCDEDIQVSVPSFNATSFLRFSPLGVPPSTVALSFNPATAHGLLFHHGDLTINRDFVSISVIEQQVEFRFDLGSGPAILMSEPVSLNDWHYVQATREGRNGVLQVDGGAVVTGQSEGTLTILNVNSDIFVGGVADYDTVSPHAGTEVGLIGCIMDLEIDGETLDLVAMATGGQDISECSTDPCVGQPCSNGGTCHGTGTSTATCLCPLGFAGPTCNAAIDIAIPYFTGLSHLAYNSLSNTFATTSVTLDIRPASSDGLILFNQQTNGRDFIAVLLRDGHVEFWYDLGSGALSLVSSDPLELDEWHTIEVYRSGRSGQLIVDGTLPLSGMSPGSLNGLQLGDPLYIGGVGAAVSDSIPQEIRVGGYEGCVRSVLIGQSSTPLSLISDAVSGAGIAECPRLPCTINPCLNNGACYLGEVNGTTGEQCYCSLPFTGDLCSERVEGFSEAYFSGQSYLEFTADAVPIDLMRVSTAVEISLSPASLTGLFFYMGPVTAHPANDYLYIALSDGLVELRFNLGSGDGTVMTSQPLAVGMNYTISVQRQATNAMLLVSGGDSASGQAPAGSYIFDYIYTDTTFVAYLGGAPNVAAVTGETYSSGLSGCLTAVSLGQVGSLTPLPLDSAATGAAVELCPDT